MIRALAVVLALAATAACVPPHGPAGYDAANDVIVVDDAALTAVAEAWGPPGVEWIMAHEHGHQEMMARWRNDHVALWLLMPGGTAKIQIEQVAQCLAAVALGHGAPWDWEQAEVDAGYWRCPDDYVSLVADA